MSLTEHQQLNSLAPAFDVQLRYFGGVTFRSLAVIGVSTTLASWTNPDTPPVGWTEITSRVNYASRLTQTWQGSSLTFQAELSGWDYDDTLLETGLTVVCFRRIWRATGTGTAPAGWQGWIKAFVGEIVAKTNRDDYRHGQAWSRTVVGYDNLLNAINAPRLTTGRILATDGASVTGTEALAQPEYERDTGEFVGGRASVEISNVVDGNINTLYISDTIPSGTSAAWPGGMWDGSAQPSEVFFKPYAGWPVDRAWWVEVFNQRTQDATGRIGFMAATHSGGVYTYYDVGNGENWPKLTAERAMLFVANRKAFDELFGSDNNGAEYIVDVSNFLADVHLTDDSAIVAGSGVIAWAPGGASRDYVFPAFWAPEWHGATLNSTACGTGQSFWNSFGSGWSVNPYPHPGANGTGDGPIWLKVLLLDNVCRTLDEVTAASTTIRLDNYVSWLTPTTGYSRGSLLSYIFRWTSRDANGLHGVTWESAPGSPIPADTRCYPYANGIPQTGYPVTMTHLVRRKLPTIKNYRVYWSAYDARGYPETGWASDYYANFHNQQGNAQNLRLSDTCADGTNNYLWVRSILYLIDAMTDGGRVKINEIEADVSQMALDVAVTAMLDGRNSYELANYLFTEWAGFAPADIVDSSYGGRHMLGDSALAVTPVARVFDDLAQTTGCLVSYRPQGDIWWLEDPWWPFNADAPVTQYAFVAASIRGEVEFTKTPNYTDYIILNALSMEDAPHSVRVVYPTPSGTTEPPTAAIVQEVNGRVVVLDNDAKRVAEMELDKLRYGARSARITVAGPGEWCTPSQKVTLQWDLDGDGTAETSTWLIEQVQTATEDDGRVRSYETVLQLRGFRG